jgi:type IV pilus assembly protein PilF
MMRKGVPLLALLLAVLAGGCVTNPPGGDPQRAVRPQADIPTQNAAQAGAKVHVDLGLAYLEVGRNEVALDEARSALQLASDYAPAYHLMGLVYMNLGDARAAREYFERALALAPGDPDFDNSYGWFLCTQGQREAGLERLLRAARNPYYRTPTRPYTNAGLCYLRDKDDAGAERFFRRAVQADPNNAEALFQLASIAYRRGDFAAASADLVELHQRYAPTAASLWLGLRTERRLGHREAEASYAAQLRNRFAGSPEFQALAQGRFE